MPVSAEEYQRLVQREMKRYGGDPSGGPERDKAIRSANIAAGYGNSTALKHPARTKEGQVRRGDGKGDRDTPTPEPRPREERVPRPQKRPSLAERDIPYENRREEHRFTPYEQRKPEPSQGFPDDLAVSPRRDRMDWEGATESPPPMPYIMRPPVVMLPGGGPQTQPPMFGNQLGMSDLLSVLAGGGPMRMMPPGWGM